MERGWEWEWKELVSQTTPMEVPALFQSAKWCGRDGVPKLTVHALYGVPWVGSLGLPYGDVKLSPPWARKQEPCKGEGGQN